MLADYPLPNVKVTLYSNFQLSEVRVVVVKTTLSAVFTTTVI
jgi:hypothetical protein